MIQVSSAEATPGTNWATTALATSSDQARICPVDGGPYRISWLSASRITPVGAASATPCNARSATPQPS
ncbi:MAG: hypothetical protein ACRDTC_20845 [Pseudonocardiaceae bacterium]